MDDSRAIELKTVDTDGNSYKDSRVYVQKIDGLSDDFMRGVDISSYLSEEESGVVFKDYDGNDISFAEPTSVIVGNPEVQAKLTEIIRDFYDGKRG